MHLQVVPRVLSIRAPCVVQQLTPGDDPTDIIHQLPQNDELLARKVNRYSSDHEPLPIELQLHVTHAQDP